MTRGGSPQEVADVLARARERAGVREVPTVSEAAAPPASGPSSSDDRRGEGAPRHEGSLCRSCSARILWAQLLDEAGERQKKSDGKMKAIPIDFEAVADGNVVVFHRPGQGIVCRVLKRGELPPPGARTRVSHFATCVNAAKHRKKPMARDVRPPTKEDVARELALPSPADVDPDFKGKCEVCGASPVLPATGMCGPCTTGEADTAGGEW